MDFGIKEPLFDEILRTFDFRGSLLSTLLLFSLHPGQTYSSWLFLLLLSLDWQKLITFVFPSVCSLNADLLDIQHGLITWILLIWLRPGREWPCAMEYLFIISASLFLLIFFLFCYTKFFLFLSFWQLVGTNKAWTHSLWLLLSLYVLFLLNQALLQLYLSY